MAETNTAEKEFKAETVGDLEDDPTFSLMPPEAKLKKITDLSSKDHDFMNRSGAVRDAIIQRLLKIKPQTQATGTAATPLDPSQPEGSVQTVDTPYDRINAARADRDTPALDVLGRTAVHTLDAPAGLANLAVRGVGAIARAGGAPGIPSDESIAHYATPAENLLTGDKGFPPQDPGTAIVQHLVDNAVGGALGGLAVGTLMPALQGGIPLTEQAINATYQALKGATASEAAKMTGLPSWVQVGADLVAGGMSKEDVKKLFTHLKNKPFIQKYVLDNQVKQLSQNAETAFAGPSAAERAATPAGDIPPTVQAHTQALTQSVEDIKAPVTQATQARVTAEAHAAGASAQADTAAAQTDLMRQQAQTLKETTGANVLQAVEETRAAKLQALAATKRVQEQQDVLTRATLSNEQMVNRALTDAEDTTSRLAPEMAQAGEEARQVGRGMKRRAGAARQQFYDNAYGFFMKRAEKVYDDLWSNHHIEAPADPLLNAINRYEDSMKAVLQERYEPAGYIREVQKYVANQGSDTGIGMPPTTLGIKDAHAIRSSILGDLRHSPASSARNKPLKQLLREINAYIDEVVASPEVAGGADAVADMKLANSWYRTEMHRFSAGPGEETLKINPTTGNPVHSPEVIGHMIFDEGPQVAGQTAKQAKNLSFFAAYMDDIDATMARAKANFDLPLIDQIQAAKDGVLDVARAKFYDAAMVDGVYSTKAAGVWLKKHDALIRARPELEQLFGDAQAAHRTILDVQAHAQGLLAEEKGYLAQFERQAELAGRAETDVSTNLAMTREAANVSNTRAEGQLAQIRQQQTAAQGQAHLASETAASAKAQEAQAIQDYTDTFGSRNAAKHALAETHAAEVLGASPSDIVHQIESMADAGERSFAYTKWFRQAGNDPTVKDAILYEKWKNFVGESGVADPGKASQFIEDNTKFLKTFYPQYYKDIKTVQDGFAKAAELQKETGIRVWRRTGMEGGAIVAMQMLGVGHFWPLVSAGAAYELGRAAKRVRNVGALTEVYTSQASAHTLAQAMRSGNQSYAAGAMWSLYVRAGVTHPGEQGE